MVMQPGAPALAQNYPSKPVTIIVPLAAGTGMDTLARLYAEQLSQALGKPVVIENKPGAGLMLGTAAIAAAPPDGHTLGISTATPMAVNQVLYKKMTYDPNKDLTPVYFYVKSPFVLVVNPALPINSVPELIKYARESATPMSYSTPGAGTSQHLSMEFMAQRFGLKVTHVPYRSSPQSITDIAAGHVNLGFAEAGVLLGPPAHPARGAPVRRSRGRARFRGGVLAHPVRAGGNADRDRRPPARRDAAHHVDARHEEARLGHRPSPARFAPDRGDP
jgi:tripartite-type tricarboxylate transporter receptor subunit TctC